MGSKSTASQLLNEYLSNLPFVPSFANAAALPFLCSHVHLLPVRDSPATVIPILPAVRCRERKEGKE